MTDVINFLGERVKPRVVLLNRKGQGRSNKILKPVIEHDGRVWVARFEGRPERAFGDTQRQVHQHLTGAYE